jgi:flagellar motor switch protein FliN/FliY
MDETKTTNEQDQPAATAPPEAEPESPAETPAEERAEEKPAALQPSELKPQPSGEPLDLDFILDIPLQVKVEVGRTRMMIQELLKLTKGSVVELNKMLGETFEVMVNDKLVARGEIVIVNDHFGVRLTDIISPNDRVKSLG